MVFTSLYGYNNSPLDFDDLNLEKDYTTLKTDGRTFKIYEPADSA